MTKKLPPKKLKKRNAADWEAVIGTIPKMYRNKVASTVFWDFVSIRGGNLRTSEYFRNCLDDYDYETDGAFMGEDVARMLIRVGYTKKDAAKKCKTINDLHNQVSIRNAKIMKLRGSKYK